MYWTLMLRYAVLALVGVVASSALAQQAPPQAGTPSPLSSSASVQPAQAVISMEDPLPGDHWTYEVRGRNHRENHRYPRQYRHGGDADGNQHALRDLGHIQPRASTFMTDPGT